MSSAELEEGPEAAREPAPVAPGEQELTPAQREELVVSHLSLVEAIVAGLFRRGLRFEREELLSAGREGLVEAAGRFRGAPEDFGRFAYHRVRGSMLDHLRRAGPWSRRAWQHVKLLRAADSLGEPISGGPLAGDPEGARRRLEGHLGRLATAVALGMLAEPVRDVDGVQALDQGLTAESLLLRSERRQRLSRALSALPEPEATVVRRHYLEGESLADVARDYGFGRSWASRIQVRGIGLLWEELRRDS